LQATAGLCAGWEIAFYLPETAAIENIKLKLSTKADRYSSAETEAK
jgi:hypothetical protein